MISSKTTFEVQDKSRFKKRFSNKVSSNSPTVNKSNVRTPKPQEGKGGRSYVEKPLCAKYDKRHDGKCLVGMGYFYGCGNSGHMKTYCYDEDSRKEEFSNSSMCPKSRCS